MRGIRPQHADSLSAEQLRRVDMICQGFEAAWQQGQAPSLEEALSAEHGMERTALLCQLLWLEVHYRGGQADPAEYEARFPRDTSLVRAVFADVTHLLPRGHVPQIDRFIRRGGRQGPAVGGEQQGGHAVFVALEHVELLARIHVPEAD